MNIRKYVTLIALFIAGISLPTALPVQAAHLLMQTIAGKPGVTLKVTSSKLAAHILGGTAHVSHVDVADITVLEDVMADPGVSITMVKTPKLCHWTKGGFWNSGKDANGVIHWFWDPIPAELCPSKNSPSGWVKVAGGTSGRDCENFAKTGTPPRHALIVRGKVLMVHSFLHMMVKLHASATVSLHAVCGHAGGSGSSSVLLSLSTYLRSSGPTKTGLSTKVFGQAKANASANLHCVVGPARTVTTTTESTTTVRSKPTTSTVTTTTNRVWTTTSSTPAKTTTVTTSTPAVTTNVTNNTTTQQTTTNVTNVTSTSNTTTNVTSTTVTTPTTTVVTTTTTPTTTVTTTTPSTTTTTATPTCSAQIPNDNKNGDPYTANVVVGGSAVPSSVTYNWGNGTDTVSATTRSHTYPKPAPAPAGTYDIYTISVSAIVNGVTVQCGSGTFHVPSPPPSGTTTAPATTTSIG